MEQKQLIANIRDAVAKVITESVENYKNGVKKVAWSTVDYNLDTGRIMIVLWPNDDAIGVHWTPASSGYGDLGTLIGSVSMEYFGIDSVVTLLTSIINAFMEE